MINWNAIEKSDMQLIQKIVKRAVHGKIFMDTTDLDMDISAAHIKCPMNLKRFLAFDEFNFAHDVGGIRRHVNRVTGDLMDCFVPRCAI